MSTIFKKHLELVIFPQNKNTDRFKNIQYGTMCITDKDVPDAIMIILFQNLAGIIYNIQTVPTN